MASNVAFSPKEWEVWVIGENPAGTTGNTTSGMYQLDVDSISMPSLNVNQQLDVRSGVGRTLKTKDFYQDNNLRVVELGLSGRWHDDAGHLGLISNITADSSPAAACIPHNYSPDAIIYGQSATAGHFDTFTCVLKAPNQTTGKNIELAGCVVTNFSWSADMNTDGGQYKWSATIQTGDACDFADQTDSGATPYANTTFFKLSSATTTEVLNTAATLNSFTLTIDNPAVFAGTDLNAAGYEVVNRGSECVVTVDCQVKYDDNTDELINVFDTQTAAFTTAFAFALTAASAGGVKIHNAVITNVALSEGDIMMLDVSMKAVSDGTDDLLELSS